MWLFAVGLSALAAAIAQDEAERQHQAPLRLPAYPDSFGPSMMMKHKMASFVIDLDGEPYHLVEVEDNTEGMGTITVLNLEDETEEVYHVFSSEERAGELARENVKEDLLWGIDSSDPDMRRRAVENVVERVGKDTLVLWALGQPAGPGYAKVESLDEWFDLFADNPEEHWNYFDSQTITDIGPNAKDHTEGRILLGESAWERIIEELGFEPEVAYRRD